MDNNLTRELFDALDNLVTVVQRDYENPQNIVSRAQLLALEALQHARETEEITVSSIWACSFCSGRFFSQKDLMTHNTLTHGGRRI